ncbi:putative chemoreceptor glutamine deamidase CheD [Sulfitobacter noctilucae]|uniref:chemotaxis protein CheD n=1 Tax=Sulfitobacter noctilucae TaxID=1342302 RepID=UPI00046A324F|nr:chemotaxis protein CheD [Sulfitobacter noctilucae]KIN61101.1 putative chemoreceptor glutamine deamidase CheD [Sulfitobacter noctilucae]
MTGGHVITQGEHYVSADPQATISTLLGSCVACCLWDPLAAVGGMNHILLATTSRNAARCDLVGVNAMELLINDLLKLGARRDRLKAKLFGGAQMINGLSEIGPANCAFATGFLEQESIPCVSQSLGGEFARQIIFTPSSGAVRAKTTRGRPAEAPPRPAPAIGNDLELF